MDARDYPDQTPAANWSVAAIDARHLDDDTAATSDRATPNEAKPDAAARGARAVVGQRAFRRFGARRSVLLARRASVIAGLLGVIALGAQQASSRQGALPSSARAAAYADASNRVEASAKMVGSTAVKSRGAVTAFDGSQRVEALARRATRRHSVGPWGYVLATDHGVRRDASGAGHFRAPRYHGEHNGIDLLAPIGTPVMSPCAGQGTSGVSASFGNWVRVVCEVPESLAGERDLYASLFYAHLDESRITSDRWARLRRGQTVGSVGKTGNAGGTRVQPHLHLELIVQNSLSAAIAERHYGRDQSVPRGTESFFEQLEQRCLTPHDFRPRSGRVRRGRRADPFLVLTCLTSDKPDYEHAPKPLGEASRPWSALYSARAFDVDDGPHSFLLADE